MIESIGWISGILLAVCAFPQAFASCKHGHSYGLTWGLLVPWGGGELGTFVYVLFTTQNLPLLLNYGANLISMSIIIWYKARPRVPMTFIQR